MLRKQLLEINSGNRNGSIDPATAPLITASLMSNLPLTNRLGSPVTTQGPGGTAIPANAGQPIYDHPSGLPGGLAFPALNGGIPAMADAEGAVERGAYQEQLKNALAKLLSANQQSQYELGSNGNTPEIPSGSVTSNSESSEINVKQEMDDIDVCRIDDTLEVCFLEIFLRKKHIFCFLPKAFFLKIFNMYSVEKEEEFIEKIF